MYGWCVWALTTTLIAVVEPVAMSVISGPLKFSQRLTSMNAGWWRAGNGAGLLPPWWMQHDERLDALLLLQLVDERVDRVDLAPELEARDAGRRDDRRRALERQSDERDLRAVDRLHLVLGQDRLVGALEVDVRGEVLEERAREGVAVLAAVDAGDTRRSACAEARRRLRRTRGCPRR